MMKGFLNHSLAMVSRARLRHLQRSVTGPDSPEALNGFRLLFEAEPPRTCSEIRYHKSWDGHYISFSFVALMEAASFLHDTFWGDTVVMIHGDSQTVGWHDPLPPQWPRYWPIAPSPESRKIGFPAKLLRPDWHFIYLDEGASRFFLAAGESPAEMRQR